MLKKYIFAIIGGDKRQEIIAKKLIDLGHQVRMYGFPELDSGVVGAELFSNLERAVLGCDIMLLPLPVSRDGINLSIQNGENIEAIKLENIISLAVKGGCMAVVGGMIPQSMLDLAKNKGLYISDYYKDEKLQIKNALPSAEGSVMIAMENTESVINGMSVIVCGYGRIGSRLSDILYRMGADVTVMARRDECLCESSLKGYKSVRLSQDNTQNIVNAAKECDVIFNTVPNVIFTHQINSQLTNKPLYIEIASSPGGIDLCSARECGIRTVFAPSLPGRYAPITAGEYILETIFDILEKRGIDI